MAGLEGTFNFRDTGGMTLAAGGSTRPAALYRSDALSTLTPRGIDELAASPIGVVVDFRTPIERQLAPDRLPTARTLDVAVESILEGAMAGMATELMAAGSTVDAAPEAVAAMLAQLPSLGDLYVGMLDHAAAAFAHVARLVAASGDRQYPGVLVHCTAGKDRTGVAVAVLLDAVGAERVEIVADYTASGDNLEGAWAEAMFAMITAMGVPLSPELRVLVSATPASAIEQALAWVDAEHGGSADYLRSGGLTDQELRGLRSRLAG